MSGTKFYYDPEEDLIIELRREDNHPFPNDGMYTLWVSVNPTCNRSMWLTDYMERTLTDDISTQLKARKRVIKREIEHLQRMLSVDPDIIKGE